MKEDSELKLGIKEVRHREGIVWPDMLVHLAGYAGRRI